MRVTGHTTRFYIRRECARDRTYYTDLYKEAEHPQILFLRAPEQTRHGQLYFGI